MPVGKWERIVICERKKMDQDKIQEGKTIARVLGLRGMVSINPFLDYKDCFFVESKEKAEWLQKIRGWM